MSVIFTVQPYGDYWVLSTDYTTYSIVWSCMETPKGPIQFNSRMYASSSIYTVLYIIFRPNFVQISQHDGEDKRFCTNSQQSYFPLPIKVAQSDVIIARGVDSIKLKQKFYKDKTPAV